MDRKFWRPGEFIAQESYRSSDLNRLMVTDSPQQAVAVITDAAKRRFGLTYGPSLKRPWFFNEVEPS